MFMRSDRIAVRASIANSSSMAVKARLLSRLGQPLADLPVVVLGNACEAAVALGALGLGDYVVEIEQSKPDPT